MNGRPRSAFHRMGIILLGLLIIRSPAATAAVSETDYENTNLVTGTIYEKRPEPRRVLFKFRRTATRSDSTVRVLREYYPLEGSLAARERVVYEKGKLVSCELEELQTGATGRVVIGPDPQKNNQPKLFFQYTPRTGAPIEAKSEALRPDVLISDMIPWFVSTHWEQLMKGSSVKFRFIVFQRAETIGFKLLKDSEGVWHGKPVVILRMEPTSLVIAQLVDPVFFTVEKSDGHRILQYVGRTTPMIKKGNKWESLDAVSVFEFGTAE